MRDDSPTRFVRFKKKKIYDRSLEVLVQVQNTLDHAKVRHHLKDRLDRGVTALVMEIARADMELPSQRWRPYRAAHRIALDIMVQLDILAAQQPTLDIPARTSARALCEDLAKLASGRES